MVGGIDFYTISDKKMGFPFTEFAPHTITFEIFCYRFEL